MSEPGRIYVVRHGESGWNVEGRHQGQSLAAPGLTALGKSHAAAVAAALAQSGAEELFSSDLRRAFETAFPIAGVLGVRLQLEPRLRERSFGVIEGRPIAGVDPAVTGVRGDLVIDADARPEGGESIRELYDRVIGLLEELCAGPSDRRTVLVSHGGPIRVIGACLAGFDADAMSWSAVANGSVIEIPLDRPFGG